jgi:hypothetical protein
MTSTKNQNVEHSPQARLEALLDKLVAVQLDLEPVHQGKPYGATDAHHDSTAMAYGLVRSAIADLREIIQQLNGPIIG